MLGVLKEFAFFSPSLLLFLHLAPVASFTRKLSGLYWFFIFSYLLQSFFDFLYKKVEIFLVDKDSCFLTFIFFK